MSFGHLKQAFGEVPQMRGVQLQAVIYYSIRKALSNRELLHYALV